jgi:hypothetical protein
MSDADRGNRDYVVLGQKYAYATISLVLGIACFINLAGLEKAILAITFAWLALKREPAPVLKNRRFWAKTGLALGATLLILVPTIIVLNLDRLRSVIEVLSRLADGK